MSLQAQFDQALTDSKNLPDLAQGVTEPMEQRKGWVAITTEMMPVG